MVLEIKQIESVGPVVKTYNTGEQPVLLCCNDGASYVCKFGKSIGAQYKLVCEWLGYVLASVWGLDVPKFAVVNIWQEHLSASCTQSITKSYKGIGSRLCTTVVDVTDLSLFAISNHRNLLEELINIALFDMWVANEDRNVNNYNLLYDVAGSRLVPIDFGCIFNTATFDYPLSQLTLTDSLLYSDLYKQIVSDKVVKFALPLRNNLEESVSRLCAMIPEILSKLPATWNVPKMLVEHKLYELCSDEWVNGVWSNFMENIIQTE